MQSAMIIVLVFGFPAFISNPSSAFTLSYNPPAGPTAAFLDTTPGLTSVIVLLIDATSLRDSSLSSASSGTATSDAAKPAIDGIATPSAPTALDSSSLITVVTVGGSTVNSAIATASGPTSVTKVATDALKSAAPASANAAT